MRIFIFPLTLLFSSLVLPAAARADAIDDFVLTGDGNVITFSLPASPPGNHSVCPPTSPSCLPGSETAFYVSTTVTTNGVSTVDDLAFPTFRFGGGLSSPSARYLGDQLFTPNAADPTFRTGSFTLGTLGAFPPPEYTLTITPETVATPEPASMLLLVTGVVGLIGLVGMRRRRLIDQRFSLSRF